MKEPKNIPIIILILIVVAITLFLISFNQKAENIIFINTSTQVILGKPKIVHDVPKDAIPPLDFPKYVKSSEVNFLDGADLVVGVEFNGDVRAYPIKIMNWHEIVNDNIGGLDVVVTYCPLCKSGIVFSRNLNNKILSFGNTGSLYESTLLMYDRETESFWAQVGGRAIEGNLKGKRLKMLPSTTTIWAEWQTLHPNTLVLSLDTGYTRNYDSDPYLLYDLRKNSLPSFPISLIDKRLPPKEMILGIVLDGAKKAYPYTQFGWKVINEKVGNKNIAIFSKPSLTSIFFAELDGQIFEFELVNKTIIDKNTKSTWNFLGEAINGSLKGKRLQAAPLVHAFWFGWVAEYPDTELFSDEDDEKEIREYIEKQNKQNIEVSNNLISIPIDVYVVKYKDKRLSSSRNEENIKNVFENVNKIWKQANIKLDINKIEFIVLSDTSNFFNLNNLVIHMVQSRSYNKNKINAYFVKTLHGSNGIAFAGNIIIIADKTTVYDFRATAHEIGHILGLSHVAPINRLMAMGVNGFDLTEEETEIARRNVLKLFS